ncbi:MAG: PAS domain S-box protein [Halofilum sp. (in: g-proteobacteria)]
MNALSVALASATATTLLIAIVIGWLRGLPGRGHGITGWLSAFLLFALAWAVAFLLEEGAPELGGGLMVVLQLFGAVALFSGIRVFFGRSPLLGIPAAIAGLTACGFALAVIAGTGFDGLLWSAVAVTALLLVISGGLFFRLRPREARFGHLATAAALVALGVHVVAVAAWSAPGGLSVAGVMTGQVLLLALAPGMANVVHQRTYQRLRQAERRLAHAIEALDQGFALYDADERLVMANEAYCSMFPLIRDRFEPGVSYSELLEASARAGQCVGAAGREREWIRERIEHHRSGNDVREEQLADGRWLYLVERRMPDGESVSLRIDITAIKQRAQEVADSEARYRDLIEGSIQGIIIDHDWRMIFANPAAAEMLGFGTPAELLGRESLRHLVEDHEIERLHDYHAARNAGVDAPAQYEADMRRADGRTITVQWMVRHIRWRGEKVTQSTLVDISERKRAERALRDHQERLEELVGERTAELETANRELEAFSYSVSHDLAAPLRHVRGFACALEEDYGDRLDAAGRDYLARVLAAAERMQTLIDDLLALSRLTQAGLQRECVDLSALAAEVVSELRNEDTSGRDVRVDIAPGLQAEGDPRLLRIVLDNLFANAWKYTAREPTARIRFHEETRAGMVWYVVDDNGVGFDMAYGERLFGPFQRLHKDEDFAGVGVGLATVARIVHRHGGRVHARGAVGEGAAIAFTLRAVPRRDGNGSRTGTDDVLGAQ